MKFNKKTSQPITKTPGLTKSPKLNLFPSKSNMTQQVKIQNLDSKNTDVLFSIKSTTKMKRTYHKNAQSHHSHQMPISCVSCAKINTNSDCYFNDEQDLANLNFKTSEKYLKKVSLKAIGISFANLFKPNKRIIRNNNQNVLINNQNNFQSKKLDPETPKFSNQNCRYGKHTPVVTPISTKLHHAEFSKSTSALNELNNLNPTRKTQPSMGLKAYTIKNKKPTQDTQEIVEKQITQELNKRERMFKNKSAMLKEVDLVSKLNRNDLTKSDTNLIREVKISEEAIYDCLNNYESNKLYFEISESMKKCLDNEAELSKEQELSIDINLMPFLEVTRETLIQPMLSSTRQDNHELDNKLKATPLKTISVVSKTKKLRSLTDHQFQKFGLNLQDDSPNV